MAAPLMRTYTAPVFQHSTDGVARLQSIGMSAASRTSQLSGSTALTSTTSLTSFSSASTMIGPPQNGVVVATGNIINQKADASRSLFQICVSLKQRLAQVPGFDEYSSELDQYPTDDQTVDPVESLWALLRKGVPLLTIYNATQPVIPLAVLNEPDEEKRAKKAIAKFMAASIKECHYPAGESFAVRDLTGNDTTGFVKVTFVVNFVLDIAEKRGLLLKVQGYPEDEEPLIVGSQMSYRDHIVKELVDTERKYVQDLENLHDLKRTLEQKGAIPGDIIHQIFLNINPILDFQRKFLIRVETQNSQIRENQLWGSPFSLDEEKFGIYEPFIANQRKAAQLAAQVFDKIQSADHPVAVDFNTLDGFLLKPMQRLVKYPLLLKDLLKKSDDDVTRHDLAAGIEAAERVLQKANEAVDRDLLDEALEELIGRVDDWKNHRVDQFGRLLLHGVYTVVTGKSEQEKDYEIYLFECILLCCKEVSPTKSKDKKDKTKSTGPKVRNKHAKLQLKGRIFMTNVTDVVSLSKPGAYSVQIWWKGDPGVENFIIKFQNEETMKKWAQGLDLQRKENAPQSTTSADQPAPDFYWNQSQTSNMENPYAQQEDEDEEDHGPTGAVSQYGVGSTTQSLAGAIQRNPSSNSLRQRSATNESTQSLASIARAPPPRFPLPQPPAPLNLQTQMSTGQPSPTPRGGDSYFSPVAESPTSSRTSTTSVFPPSAGYPFPKAGTPQPGGWGSGDDNNRYTAPAMPRAPSRDGPSPVNAYGMVAMNGRNPRGPSLPAMASQTAAQQLQQQRSRSYSTPDINGQPMNARRTTAPSIPAVPGIPPHLHPAHERHDSNIPRSHTSSPRIDLPVRSETQSPSVQRERERQYAGTMAQFPTQPVYNRQGTPSNVPGGAYPPPGPPPPGIAPLAPADPSRTVSPPLGTGSSAAFPVANPDIPLPTQLKVKVNCDSGNYVTLVVAFNITYQSLIDRIDAKLARFTTSSIAKGNLKLRYRDEDGDFVTIESDDDIQIAILEWREGVRNMYSGGVGEIELFCLGETS